MASYCLILLSFFVPFPPIYAQISSSGKLAHLQNGRTGTVLWEADSKINGMEAQMHVTLPQTSETAKATDLLLQRGHFLTRHPQRHLQNVHGILVLIGWGTLLPMGVMVARFGRKFPMQCDEWYSCHILCQALGHIMGTIGWCIGIWLGSSSKQYTSKTQLTLSIIAFALINLQMISICMRGRKEGYIKWWNICHHVLGYAIVAMIIANIFEGINNGSEAQKLKWVYVGILAALALIAVALEVFRCISKIFNNISMQLTSSMHTS